MGEYQIENSFKRTSFPETTRPSFGMCSCTVPGCNASHLQTVCPYSRHLYSRQHHHLLPSLSAVHALQPPHYPMSSSVDALPGPYSILSTETTHSNQPKRKRSWSRAVFSNLQRKGLEKRFEVQKYVTKPDRRQLAAMLGLTDAQVKVWFQNRRMKWRHAQQQGDKEVHSQTPDDGEGGDKKEAKATELTQQTTSDGDVSLDTFEKDGVNNTTIWASREAKHESSRDDPTDSPSSTQLIQNDPNGSEAEAKLTCSSGCKEQEEARGNKNAHIDLDLGLCKRFRGCEDKNLPELQYPQNGQFLPCNLKQSNGHGNEDNPSIAYDVITKSDMAGCHRSDEDDDGDVDDHETIIRPDEYSSEEDSDNEMESIVTDNTIIDVEVED